MIKLINKLEAAEDLHRYNHVTNSKMKLISDIGSASLLWILGIGTILMVIFLFTK